MTDQKDYTREPEVLAACGLEYVGTFGRLFVWKRPCGEPKYLGISIDLTMQELWEGLCKACKSLLDYGFLSPRIDGIWRVELVLRDGSAAWDDEDNLTLYYYVNECGSLTNAIAAALYWVLQQKKEG